MEESVLEETRSRCCRTIVRYETEGTSEKGKRRRGGKGEKVFFANGAMLETFSLGGRRARAWACKPREFNTLEMSNVEDKMSSGAWSRSFFALLPCPVLWTHCSPRPSFLFQIYGRLYCPDGKTRKQPRVQHFPSARSVLRAKIVQSRRSVYYR